MAKRNQRLSDISGGKKQNSHQRYWPQGSRVGPGRLLPGVLQICSLAAEWPKSVQAEVAPTCLLPKSLKPKLEEKDRG